MKIRIRNWIALGGLCCASGVWAQSSEPNHAYLFPAGGQRGTQVTVTVEGENITRSCDFHLRPTPGVTAPPQTRDRRITLTLDKKAPLGIHPWRLATANGGTGSRGFVIGDYPEVLEEETGPHSESAQPVTLPVTVNGRVNPRADVDRFSFELDAGQRFFAEVMAARLGGPIDTNVFTGQFGNPPGDITYKQLDASLKVFGPDGKLVAQAEDTFGLDPAVGFRAPARGRYVAEIHHLAHAGMPQFVYRLTLAPGALVEAVYPAGGRRGTSDAVALVSPAFPPAGDGDQQLGDVSQTLRFAVKEDACDLPTRLTAGGGMSNLLPLRVGDHPEVREAEPNDRPEQAAPVSLPATLNGRFLTPGDTDLYRVRLRKGETWRFDAWVARIGSPTDADLSLIDAAGRVVATNDDGVPGTHDPRFWYTASADGEYLLQIRETGMSRLGERLVYRLEAHSQAPDFELEAGPEAPDVSRGGSAEINVSVRRLGGFAGPLTITAEGLPAGVSCVALTLNEKQDKGKLKLTAVDDARPGSGPIRIVARGVLEDREATRAASVPVANPAEVALGSAPRYRNDLLLTVRYPIPFKIEADDSYVFMNLGTLYPAKVTVTREPGFTAPLAFSAADRQPRDPQGITFAPMVVAGQEKEVFFPMRLPQGPRGNPIVRMYVKAEAVVKDAEGREWHLLQTSPKQVVLRTQAPVFSLDVEPAVVRAKPGTQVPLRFRLGRTASVPGNAEIRLSLPGGMQGFTLDEVPVKAGTSEAEGLLRIAPGATLGTDNRLWFEATTKRGDNGHTVFFRVPVELDLLQATP